MFTLSMSVLVELSFHTHLRRRIELVFEAIYLDLISRCLFNCFKKQYIVVQNKFTTQLKTKFHKRIGK